METYNLTLMFNGESTTTVVRRFRSPAALLDYIGSIGEGWGARISITDEQARRLGVYESTYGEMLLPVADEEPLTVSIRLARSIQSRGGRARAKSMSKSARSTSARNAAMARWSK